MIRYQVVCWKRFRRKW